jgi:hypothetical protein
MKLSMLELERMARRGAEDGHDPAWHAQMTDSPRIRAAMKQVHDATLVQMKRDEDQYLAACDWVRRSAE